MSSPVSSPPPGSTIIPKWLQPQPRSRISYFYRTYVRSLLFRFTTLLRPRLTWRYVLTSLAGAYILYCFVTSQPVLACKLPAYTGPHGVGAVDLEVPLEKPKRVSDAVFKGSGDPAFEVESVLLTIYYPTEKGFRSKKSKYPWLPRPVSLKAEGYAKIAHVNNFITRPIFAFFLWALVGGIKIPAEVDAPLLATSPFLVHEDAETENFPFIVFSHGMASSRTDYTNYIGELASRGNIVAAIEHRDGSSPGSFVKLATEDPGHRRLPILQSDLKEEMDTPEFKRVQLAYRDAEILAAIELLFSINAGVEINNVRANVDTLSSWSKRLNTTHFTIAGHSYGATGALQALSTVSPTPNTTTSIILDPGKSSGPLNGNVSASTLVIHSISWSKTRSIFNGRPHFDTVRDLVRAIPHPSWFFTSLRTSHPSVTDAPLIEPLLLSWTTGAGLDVKDALKEYVRASNEFLRFVRTGEKSPMFMEAITHEEYGNWVSEKRRKEFPEQWATRWEIHATPNATDVKG